jgi:hypothetical protein
MYGYKIYPLYLSSFPLSLCLPPSHWYPPPEKTYLWKWILDQILSYTLTFTKRAFTKTIHRKCSVSLIKSKFFVLLKALTRVNLARDQWGFLFLHILNSIFFWSLNAVSHLLGRCFITGATFYFHYFSDRVSNFLPGEGLDHDPPNYDACIAGMICVWHGMIGMYHYTQLIDWDGGLANFCPCWSWAMILLISTSCVAGITGMSHHPRPHPHYFMFIYFETGSLYVARADLEFVIFLSQLPES